MPMKNHLLRHIWEMRCNLKKLEEGRFKQHYGEWEGGKEKGQKKSREYKDMSRFKKT